jgi:hypothetical protein
VRGAIWAAIIWLGTFFLLTAPYHSRENNFLNELRRLIEQAASLDEELIVVTCITVWSLALGCMVAAIRLPHDVRPSVWDTSEIAAGAFALLIVGSITRHTFHGTDAKAFHVVFSIAVGVISVAMLIVGLRRHKC